MSTFYTSINRMGNSLLYRGYDGTKRIKKKIKFKPTLYVKGKGKSKFSALDGTNVDAIQFGDMREAKDFVEKYKDVANFTVYGNTNYISQFVAEEFPGAIKFDRARVRVHTIDIEVMSDAGFPEPEHATSPIVSIALKDSVLDVYYVWALKDYDVSKAKMKTSQIRFIKCVNEQSLLKQFIDFWHDEFTCPDIVTGWNIRTFDIPYIVNRINRLFGEDEVKLLSPWGMVDERMVSMKKGQVQIYDIVGIAQLDYLDLFQKFGYSFGPQENYRLDTIAEVVLGEKKLDYSEHSNLHQMYMNDHQKYIDYNIRDVELVDRMEDKIGLITLALTMAYKAGVNYNDTFGTTAIWDSLIHKTLIEQNIVVPPNKDKFKSDYDGGYVKEPQCGIHDWVASFDVNSLYPNIIVQWNMSPETLLKGDIEPGITVDRMLGGYINTQPGKSLAASGQYFSNEKQGFMPKIIEEMYEERTIIKKKMLDAKQKLEKINQEITRRKSSSYK